VLFAVCVAPAASFAQVDAHELMKKADKQHRIKEERTKIRMTLIDANGDQRARTVENVVKQDDVKGDKGLFRFLTPADVKGTALLSEDQKPGGDTDQWLYLPAFRKTRRLGSADLGDRFVDTDFSYEDLKRRWVDDYGHTLLREEAVDGQACYVIESTPKAKRAVAQSPYGKSQFWLRKDNLLPIRLRHFDKQLRPLKQIDLKDVKQVHGDAWRPMEITVLDIQRKHKTVLAVESRDVNFGIPPEHFSRHNLEK
jgi:hypothetical protein